jgi:hypothetical protein
MNHETEVDPQDLFTTETAGLPEASSPSVIRLHDGDRLDLGLGPVRKRIEGGASVLTVWPVQSCRSNGEHLAS